MILKRLLWQQVLLVLFLSVMGMSAEGLSVSEPDGEKLAEDYGRPWGEELIPRGFVAKDLKAWIAEIDHVEAVLYDYSADPERHLVDEAGNLHKGVAKAWTKRLTNEELGELTACVTGEHQPLLLGGFCGFRPHHGFIFRGRDSEILGFISICFLCDEKFHDPQNGLSSYWDYAGLRKFVEKLGFPNLRTDEEWAAFFSDKEKVGKGGKDQPE